MDYQKRARCLQEAASEVPSIQRNVHRRPLYIVCSIFGIFDGFGHRIIHRSGGDTFRKSLAGTSTEQAGVQQGVAAKTVRAVHGYTRAFAGREQAVNNGAFAVNPTIYFTVGGDWECRPWCSVRSV